MKNKDETTTVLTADQVRTILDYDRNTGQFRRRACAAQGKAWNAQWANRAAGYIGGHGYIYICVFSQCFPAHRIAWLLVYGEWPTDQIDHINGDRKDNRISNLRLATNAQNAANSRRRAHNTSGFKGAFFHKRRNRWMAQIGVNGRQFHLGYFDTPEAAHAAYCEAAREHYGEFARAS